MNLLKKSIRLLVADDHALFRSGLISLLKPEDDIYVVGEANNGQELIDIYFSTSPVPDIALVDISMPVMSGLDAAKNILNRQAAAKILFLSMYEDEEYIYHCIKAGGKGLLNKNILKEDLISAIKQVYRGEEYYKNSMTREKLEKLYKSRESYSYENIVHIQESLSWREEEILRLIGEGLTSGEIGDKLEISRRTVDSYRATIIQKLNLKSLPDLIKYAVFHNIKP